MQIVCPECKFSRKVDESKIPARSQVATCPKCQTKFKFRDLPEEEFLMEEPTPEPAPEPSPMPAPTPEPEPAPEPEADPVLKPFTQEAPVKPEPEKPTFTNMPPPDADGDGGLWDRLHTMTPPEAAPEPEEAPQPEIEPSPPVIGSRYGQSEEPAQNQQPVEGWTGEFNEDFPDPMDYEDQEEFDPTESDHPMQVPPPFEQLDRYGFFSGLFMTIKLVLLSPRLFFSVMPVGNGVAKPLTFAILVALIQTLAQFAWGVAGLTPSMNFTPEGLVPIEYNMTNGMFELMLTPAVAAISLYILTAFYHLILSILRAGERGFEGTFRVLAYAYAPMITGIIPMPTMNLMFGWLILYAVWSLVLMAVGFKYVHKTSYLRAVPALLMPLLIIIILTLLTVQGQMPTV